MGDREGKQEKKSFRNMHQQLCQELRKENVDLVVQSSLSARERHLAAVASALWRHFFSFLKGQRMSQAVPSSQLADAAAEKEYMEQLSELTRLLFKLSEVKNIFSEAQVEYLPTPEDPKRALIQFLEAVGITYRNLQKPSDKSAMVKKSLEYLGILVKSWAQIFATSEAQKLLFRIIDCLLLPHSVLLQEKELPAPLLTAIQKSLPLYLQGMCIVCGQSQNAYLNQLLGNVIEQYIRRFLPASPQHVLDLGQHPVLLALRNSATLALMPSLKKCIVQVIRKSYLESKPILLPPRLASILAFILQLFKETNMDVSEVEQLLPGVLKCLVLVSEPQVKRLATENLQCMVKTCQAGSEGEPAAQLTAVFRHFIQDYGMRYENQIYSILETVAALDQQVVIHLIPTLTQTLKDSEQKWGLGRNMTQRKAYSKLLSHLGQVGQDEMQRLENENN
ncbi:Protein MMS22 [Myotis brandtii]|uniref:Protein MMS22-like n=1 Tax=Myotis brandtii TaxID=109478 RepID=S7PR82_MYOBR|nr:Protein MMS22 [Myotis brandtii]